MTVHEFLTQQTKSYILQLDKPFSKEKAQNYFIQTYESKFDEIIEQTKNDGMSGDILNGLKYGRLDYLTKVTAEISLKHGCLKYAEDIVNNSQN